jgi:murein DD-endopeptidase MepM/ murein hydrolase activator NlpD
MGAVVAERDRTQARHSLDTGLYNLGLFFCAVVRSRGKTSNERPEEQRSILIKFSKAPLVAFGALLGLGPLSPGYAGDNFRLGARPAEGPAMRLPLDVINVSSGFGMRADPFDQPAGTGNAQPALLGGFKRPVPPVGISAKGAKTNVATARGIGLGLAPQPTSSLPGPRREGQVLFMHEGIDLAAPTGTPVYATSDGVVIGAAPNGGYGNWIDIEHSSALSTVYGHLSAFALGIGSGVQVKEGQLIGFVGSTGRSTGPHLHFEIVSNGHAVDPLTFPGIKRTQLASQAAAY